MAIAHPILNHSYARAETEQAVDAKHWKLRKPTGEKLKLEVSLWARNEAALARLQDCACQAAVKHNRLPQSHGFVVALLTNCA